jgi:peptidyl-dipeptidase A
MKKTAIVLAIAGAAILMLSCAGDPSAKLQTEAQTFIDEYTGKYVSLFAESSEAEWALNTKIVEGDDTNRERTETANQAFAAFTGSVEVIESTRALLEDRDALTPLQVNQLEAILYQAANNPQTVPELVKERIAAEAKQTETLFGFDFELAGESVSTNRLDEILRDSLDLEYRLAAWDAAKAVGPGLKEGLVDLVALRNGTVQALGFEDYFSYQVSDYNMTTEEMIELNIQFVRELWPLYRQLHTWARYELAERYGADVPETLPAHWLPDRWGQEWAALVDVEGIDLDGRLTEYNAQWLMEQAEDFFVSLGYPELPETFWERSSLYPLPPDAPFKKNNHASAWHMDLDHDVRSLMSVEADENWWMTVHHELGHIYYYLAYTNPDVPPMLREGANRGFHEAIGYLLGLASMQKAFLQGRGLVEADAETDEIKALLKEALDQVVFIPWSAGVMTLFERDLYQGLTPEEYNQRWWDYKLALQGIVPPSERPADACDPATKTHINDDAAQYYDYAISYILLHQFHSHIANEILGQDPHNTDYYGSAAVGAFIDSILRLGGTEDWREVMEEHLGQQISAQPMLDYFAPLMTWLEEQNKNRTRTITLPETPNI